MDSADRLHQLFMELVRAIGLLQPDSASHRLSMSQAFALHELDTDTPLSQQQLAERLRLEKSSVSRLAAELERKGLLVRERDYANRRLYRLCLTEAGRKLHGHMSASFHPYYERWMAAMTPDERESLLMGLSALVRVIREQPPPAVLGSTLDGV